MHGIDGTASPGLGRRLMEGLASWLTDLPRPAALGMAAAMMALLALGDTVSPPDYHYGPFYVLPVCLCAWSLGKRAGYLVAAIGAILWTLIQVRSGTIDGPAAQLWNVATRFLSNAIIAGLLGTMRRTYDRERSLARTDGLTGALNRRAFQDAITAMLSRARRKGDVIILSYVDLDGFKAVNDTYGHAAGDIVLGAFARAATAELDPDDALARIGGDEFVLIQVGEAGADHFAAAEARHDRLTAALAALPYAVTCSMGVVIVSGGSTDEKALVALADALLYEVKRAGKNALRIAHSNDDDRAEPADVAVDPDRRKRA